MEVGNKKNIDNPQGLLYWAKQQLSVYSDRVVRLKTIYTYYTAVRDSKSVRETAKELGVSVFTVRLSCLLAKIKRAFRK